MQHAVADLLGSALVPELGTDVAARATGDVHLLLVAVAAVGALPHQLTVVLDNADLAVVATHLAVVALGVELGIHDVVVDVLHHANDSLKVVLHVRNLDVGDGTARRKLLEHTLELKLIEGIDLLGHVDVVAVGDVALVRHARDDAKTTLQALGELVGRRLKRGTVQREVNIAFGLPLGALIVHTLHDGHGKGRALLLGVAVARHVLDALIQAGIPQADGGIAAHEQLVDRLALLQAGEGTVLPKNRCGIRKRTHQTLMTAQQGAVAQLEALVEDFPELVHVLMRAQRDIGQVDGHNALVKATVVLGLVRVIVQRVGDIVKAVARAVGCQEAAATHAGVAIAVAGGLALRQLELAHLLLGDVVGHHALGGALGSQLGQVEVRGILVNVIVLEYIDKLGECRG